MVMKDIMIRNILFDWGGVLIHLDKHRCTEAFARLGVKVPLPYEKVISFYQ